MCNIKLHTFTWKHEKNQYDAVWLDVIPYSKVYKRLQCAHESYESSWMLARFFV